MNSAVELLPRHEQAGRQPTKRPQGVAKPSPQPGSGAVEARFPGIPQAKLRNAQAVRPGYPQGSFKRRIACREQIVPHAAYDAVQGEAAMAAEEYDGARAQIAVAQWPHADVVSVGQGGVHAGAVGGEGGRHLAFEQGGDQGALSALGAKGGIHLNSIAKRR